MNPDRYLELERATESFHHIHGKPRENLNIRPFTIYQPPRGNVCKYTFCNQKLSEHNRTGVCIHHLQQYLKEVGKK